MKRIGILIGVVLLFFLLLIAAGPVFMGFSLSSTGQCLLPFLGFSALGSFIYGFSR